MTSPDPRILKATIVNEDSIGVLRVYGQAPRARELVAELAREEHRRPHSLKRSSSTSGCLLDVFRIMICTEIRERPEICTTALRFLTHLDKTLAWRSISTLSPCSCESIRAP